MADSAPDAYENVVDRLLASAGLRRADGDRVARRGAFRGLRRLSRRRIPARDVAVARLGDRGVQREPAVRRFITEQLAGDLLPTRRSSSASRRASTAITSHGRERDHRRGVPRRVRASTASHVGTAWLGLPWAARAATTTNSTRSRSAITIVVRVLQQHRRCGLLPAGKVGNRRRRCTRPTTRPTRALRSCALPSRRGNRATAGRGAAARRAARLRHPSTHAGRAARNFALPSRPTIRSIPRDAEPTRAAGYAASQASSRRNRSGSRRPVSRTETRGAASAAAEARARGNALYFDANNKGFFDKTDKSAALTIPTASRSISGLSDKTYEEAALINHNDHCATAPAAGASISSRIA